MKRICFFISVCLFAVFFTGCQRTPNMSELLSYQTEEWNMQIRIKEADEIFLMDAVRTSEGISLIFRENERKDIGYFMDTEETLSMIYQDFKIPIKENEYLQCIEWFSCFNLSANESIWHIKKDTLGGIDVYVCRDGYFTVYIDCNTRVPFKITTKKTEIDVISVDKG